jgi:hypothetical protein
MMEHLCGRRVFYTRAVHGQPVEDPWKAKLVDLRAWVASEVGPLQALMFPDQPGVFKPRWVLASMLDEARTTTHPIHPSVRAVMAVTVDREHPFKISFKRPRMAGMRSVNIHFELFVLGMKRNLAGKFLKVW